MPQQISAGGMPLAGCPSTLSGEAIMFTQALQEIPIFQDLTPAQIDELSTWLTRKDFGSAQVVVNEGDSADGLYLLVRGTAEVLKATPGASMMVAMLEGPSVFGEMGLLNDEARSASVRALSRIVTGFLPKPVFEEKLQQNNGTAVRIVVNLGKIACRRLERTTARLAEISHEVSRHALHPC